MWIFVRGRGGPDNNNDRLGIVSVICIALLPTKSGILSWIWQFSFLESIAVSDTEDARVEEDGTIIEVDDTMGTRVEDNRIIVRVDIVVARVGGDETVIET